MRGVLTGLSFLSFLVCPFSVVLTSFPPTIFFAFLLFLTIFIFSSHGFSFFLLLKRNRKFHWWICWEKEDMFCFNQNPFSFKSPIVSARELKQKIVPRKNKRTKKSLGHALVGFEPRSLVRVVESISSELQLRHKEGLSTASIYKKF